MIGRLVRAHLIGEWREKSLLARSLPFVGITLLLYAFAFDPDRGILPRISPGLWWVTTTFAAMFVFARDGHNTTTTKFISQFGLEGHIVFVARCISYFVLVFIITVISGGAIIILFAPHISHVAALIVIAIISTISLSAIGAIYAPLVSRNNDAGQLLSLVVIPIMLPCLLAAIQATETALNGSTRECWGWTSLIVIFAALYVSVGALAADSIDDEVLF
jgi:heme exporter protein B